MKIWEIQCSSNILILLKEQRKSGYWRNCALNIQYEDLYINVTAFFMFQLNMRLKAHIFEWMLQHIKIVYCTQKSSIWGRSYWHLVVYVAETSGIEKDSVNHMSSLHAMEVDSPTIGWSRKRGYKIFSAANNHDSLKFHELIKYQLSQPIYISLPHPIPY